MGEYLPVIDENCCVFDGTDADFQGEMWREYLSCFDLKDGAEPGIDSIIGRSCEMCNINVLCHCLWFYRLLAEGPDYSTISPFSLAADNVYTEEIEKCMSWLRARPWFSRLWTVQEAVLAPHSTILLGPVSITYDIVSRAHASIGRQKIPGFLSSPIMNSTIAAVLWFLKFSAPMENLRQERSRGEITSLMQLCLQLNEHVATEDLDRVYSLLGLVAESGTVVDHKSSPSEMYTQMSARYMLHSGSPLPLAFCAWRLRYSDVPSWAIDSSVTSKSNLSTRSFWADAIQLYNTCGDIQQNLSLHDKTLSLLSVEADLIPEVGSIVREMNDIFLPPPDWWEIVIRLNREQKYPSGCSWLEAWWKMLCLDCSWNSHGASRATQRHIKSLATHTLFRYKDLIEFEGQLTPSASQNYKKFKNNAISQEIATASVCATRNRVFFVKKKGYLGMGHNNTARGDAVFVIPGLQCPIILRRANGTTKNQAGGRSGEKYKSVCECFIHGIMDGGAVRGKNIPIRQICIL